MMESSATQLILAATVIFLLVQIGQILYNVFLSPLSKIPGPWYASITAIPTRLHTTVFRRQSHYCHDLHQRYGPFVRMAPNEVLISDPVAFKEIHRIGARFFKTPFYHFLNPKRPGEAPYGLFQMTDPIRHAAHRKLLASGFTQAYLRSNWEETMHKKVELLLTQMKTEAKTTSGEVDLLKWLPLFAGDVIAEMMFGESFHMLERGQQDEMLIKFQTNNVGNMFAYAFPWLYAILKHIPYPKLQAMFEGNPIILQRAKEAVENTKAKSTVKNIFSKILADASKEDAVLSDEDLVVEAATFIFAGTDTTATTLTFLIWAVLSNPKIQVELEKEVAALTEPYTDEQLETLPYLNAVIKETMRLYGAAPACLPRVTPPGGAVLGGYHIPAGTIVATQAWTMHRNPSIYENPDLYDPSRWLSGLASREDVKASWSPFGAGSRICIGSNVAYMELRLATAAFFRSCSQARLAPSTTPESMEIENSFLITPVSHACKIVI